MLADADKALFLWINALVGHAPVVDAAMGWVASDYLVPVCMGLTLVSLWFIGQGRAGADALPDRDVRRAHDDGAIQPCCASSSNALLLQAASVRWAGGRQAAVLPADGLVVSIEQRSRGVCDCCCECGA